MSLIADGRVAGKLMTERQRVGSSKW